MTNKRQTKGTLRATNKNDKNDKNVKNEKNKDICLLVLSHLNTKTGRNYTPTEAHCRHINARIEEGHTTEEMKAVIDSKCDLWLSDPKMSEYLRPQTLFGTKFEGYLNSIMSEPKSRQLESWGVLAE